MGNDTNANNISQPSLQDKVRIRTLRFIRTKNLWSLGIEAILLMHWIIAHSVEILADAAASNNV